MKVLNNQVRKIKLPVIKDQRGNLSFVENSRQIPFDIKRVFYVYDIPYGVERGAHAHRNLQQFILVISGSFDVVLDDGIKETSYHLKNPEEGLYIPPMIWGRQENFSSGCSYLVLTSDYYDESEYIRNYKQFKNEKNL